MSACAARTACPHPLGHTLEPLPVSSAPPAQRETAEKGQAHAEYVPGSAILTLMGLAG